MAQMPKIYAPTPAQSVAASRGMPVSKVASLDTSIDETRQSNVTSFEEEFVLREDPPQDSTTQNQSHYNLPPQSGRLAISSHFFTSLMDYMHASNAGDIDPKLSSQRIGRMISKAIKTVSNAS